MNGEVRGSGTFVTIDGVYGILIAGHVVRNWHPSTLGDQYPTRLGVLPDRRASNLVEEPLEHFDSFVIEQRESEIFGTDLAFVRIPSPSHFLSNLLAKKSFWDLTRSGAVNRQVFITETSPIASCEVVAEKTKRSSGRITLNQYVMLGTAPQLLEREGYDYVDLRSRRSLEPRTPTFLEG